MNSELRNLAKEAKLRLKSGFWIDVRSKIASAIEMSDRSAVEVDKIRQYFREDIVVRTNKDSSLAEEDRLYFLVRDILDEDDGLNPIGRMIDRELYETMDYGEKQRYVFELSKKFQELKRRIEREREIEKRLGRYLLKN